MVADVRKVALLMSCLPRRLAETLIGRLPDHYGEAIHHCLDELTDIDDIERERIVREFLSSCKPQSRRRYRVDEGQSLPPAIHLPVPVPPEKIVTLLGKEMLQTQAVVLSQLPSAVRDDVLALMSEDRRTQVSQRLDGLPPISKAAMEDIAEVYAVLFSAKP